MLAKEASIPGQFAQRWQLRVLAREAAPEELANSKSRRLSAHYRLFNCTNAQVGDPAPIYKAANRKSAPRRRRGPAAILETEETDLTAKPQGRTFRVARYCILRQVASKHVGDAYWIPTAGRMDTLDGLPSATSGRDIGHETSTLQVGKDRSRTSTSSLLGRSDLGGDLGTPPLSLVAAPVFSSPSLPIQVPLPPSLSVQVTPGNPPGIQGEIMAI